jgi:hypothetical protein
MLEYKFKGRETYVTQSTMIQLADDSEDIKKGGKSWQETERVSRKIREIANLSSIDAYIMCTMLEEEAYDDDEELMI